VALSAAVGSINTSTAAAGNTVTISGLSFQPKIIFFWWNGRVDTTDAAGRRTHQRGFGCAVSTTDRRRFNTLSQDTPTAMVTNHSQDDAECVAITTTADAVDGLLDLQSMNSDGATLVIDDAFTADYRVHYLALGGTDLTDVAGGSFAKITTTGDQDITSLAFQPDLVMIWGTNQSNMNGSVADDSTYAIGAAVSSSQQAIIGGGNNDGAANAQSVSYCTDTEFMGTFNAGVTALNNRATYVQPLSNGFRINWNVSAATADQFNFVALKGMGVKVGGFLTQTDTSTPISTGSLGFTPRGGLVFSHGLVESTTGTVQDDDQWSCGGFSSTSARAAMAVSDDDGQGTAVVTTAVENDEVLIELDPAAGTVVALMDVNAVNSDDVEFIMDDAAPTQKFGWYVIVGDTPAAPTGHPTTRRWEGVPHMALKGSGRGFR